MIRYLRNRMLPHILEDFRIAAALVNRFFSRIISDQQDNIELVSVMKRRLHLENQLKMFIEVGSSKSDPFWDKFRVKVEIF